ncbi:MAG: hypothetical protein H6Q89_3631, partial [Myxococcaceae bacterium]|nr:hypothetical protein [Myxococcaceae bacterium]
MIAPRWRLALVAKASLLLGIAGGFCWLGYSSLFDPNWPIKALGGVGFTALGLFIAWAGGLGLADSLLGQTRTEEGVRVLQSRR